MNMKVEASIPTNHPAPAVGCDDRYLPDLDGVDFQPLFILGNNRSGTTLLYEVLAATGCFNFVDVYHLLHYDELLANHHQNKEQEVRSQLDERFSSLGIEDRGIDNVRVTSRFPEEYCFRLLGAGHQIPRLHRRTLPTFVNLCRKIQFISDPGKPILLKNPLDLPNFLYIHSKFPNARFIFIHRHPAWTLNSQLNATRYGLKQRDPYAYLINPVYTKLFDGRLGLRAYRWAFLSRRHVGLQLISYYLLYTSRYYLRNIRSFPDSLYVSVRYDDLCEKPRECVEQILGKFHLVEQTNLPLEEYVLPRVTQLLPEVERQFARLRRPLRHYLKYNCYEENP